MALLPARTVWVGAVDKVELGVGPVQFLLAVVERQSVGPVDLRVDDDGAMGPVHPSALDFRDLTPIRPVHVPEKAETNVKVRRGATTRRIKRLTQRLTPINVSQTGFVLCLIRPGSFTRQLLPFKNN